MEFRYFIKDGAVKGPATVLGKEGDFVLIRHGKAFCRCHPCHLMKSQDIVINVDSFMKERKKCEKLQRDEIQKENESTGSEREYNNGKSGDSEVKSAHEEKKMPKKTERFLNEIDQLAEDIDQSQYC